MDDIDYREGPKPIVPDAFQPLWSRLRELSEPSATLERLDEAMLTIFDAGKHKFKNFKTQIRQDAKGPILDISMEFERMPPQMACVRIESGVLFVSIMAMADGFYYYKFTRIDAAAWWIATGNSWAFSLKTPKPAG